MARMKEMAAENLSIAEQGLKEAREQVAVAELELRRSGERMRKAVVVYDVAVAVLVGVEVTG